MVHKEEFPGMEFRRSPTHIGFGATDDLDNYREMVFCSCENQPNDAKTVLVRYKWQHNSEQARCSMCGTECKRDAHSHFACWNCMEVMCVHCHLEIDDNVQNRKKVLQQRNKSAESEKCGIKHWSFDDEKWLSHREMESTRKRNVTWQKQIDYQGQGKMSGGSYAYDDQEFHTDKEKF